MKLQRPAGRLLGYPLACLGLLAAASLWQAQSRGLFVPKPTVDTQGHVYLMAASNLTEALSGLRTYGYPLVLRVLGFSENHWEGLPEIQFTVYLAAILLFWLATARFTRSAWLAVAAVTPLFFSAALDWVPLVMTDSLGASCCLISLSLLLILVMRPGNVLVWGLLGLSVSSAYWIRPAFLSLVVLIPVLGLLLRVCHAPSGPFYRYRLSLGLAALTLLPLLFGCWIRWVSVGHFGIAPLTGYQLGAIGGMMLDDDLVEELPEETRPMAAEILQKRQRNRWRPMTVNSHLPIYHRQMGAMMWKISEAVAQKHILQERGLRLRDLAPNDIPGWMGPTALEIDRRLGALGKSVITRRPLVYLKWVRESVYLGIRKLLDDPWIRLLVVLLALSLPFVLLSRSQQLEWPDATPSAEALSTLGISLLAGGHFLSNLALIALVHFPRDRYQIAAQLLVPSMLALCLAALWRRLAAGAVDTDAASPRNPMAA